MSHQGQRIPNKTDLYATGSPVSEPVYVHATSVEPVNGNPPPASNIPINEGAITSYLSRNSWPVGLQNALKGGLASTPVRFFICDDSGSMMSADGHRVVGEGNAARLVSCSRWSEMTESLRFHIGLASAAGASTEFRLLNGASPITIGQSYDSDSVNVPTLMSLLDASPGGGTPLCYHVRQIAEQIALIAPQLRAAGKKAAVIILTDGEASDGDIVATMRPLELLPVWVVIRLCTDEDKMVNYWNGIDNEIELNMDVIDDPRGEAEEIHRMNPWLTYGEPLHRLREFGVTAKEMDMIDEAKLSAEQMKYLCSAIFNVKPRDLPEVCSDFKRFLEVISDLNDQTPMVWNPITKKMSKWIDMRQLDRAYSNGGHGAKCANCLLS